MRFLKGTSMEGRVQTRKW